MDARLARRVIGPRPIWAQRRIGQGQTQGGSPSHALRASLKQQGVYVTTSAV